MTNRPAGERVVADQDVRALDPTTVVPTRPTPATRKAMQGNRSRDTKPERTLRSILHRRGLRYRVATRPLPAVRHTADIVFSRAKVAVFVDGCFWHRCPDHYRRPGTNVEYWTAKVTRNVNRDLKVDKLLEAAGWRVVRAWEHEDASAVADRIEPLVRAGAHQ